MLYQKAIKSLDKPLTTFHGLHYFITRPEPKIESNVLDIVALPYITGMISVSWDAKTIVWASETVNGCLFGELDNYGWKKEKSVADRLPQVPSVIEKYHYKMGDLEAVNNELPEDNIICNSEKQSNNYNDNDNKNNLFHGATLKSNYCKQLAAEGNAWPCVVDEQQQIFTARNSENEEEYLLDHLHVQHSYDKKVPHWIFVKYQFTPKWSTRFTDYTVYPYRIGHGSYGTIYAAYDRLTNEQVKLLINYIYFRSSGFDHIYFLFLPAENKNNTKKVT